MPNCLSTVTQEMPARDGYRFEQSPTVRLASTEDTIEMQRAFVENASPAARKRLAVALPNIRHSVRVIAEGRPGRRDRNIALKIYCFRKIFSIAFPFASSSINLSR
jgi:hypothetical protein